MLSARKISARLLEFNEPDQPDFDPKQATYELIEKPGVWKGQPTSGFYNLMLQKYEEHRRGQATGKSRGKNHGHIVPLKQTYIVKEQDGTIAVRYYGTDVVSIAPDSTITVDTGGFHTVTTAHRMVNYLPTGWHVYRRSRRAQGASVEQLYWACDGIPKAYEQRLSDGDTISPDGALKCAMPPIKSKYRARDEA